MQTILKVAQLHLDYPCHPSLHLKKVNLSSSYFNLQPSIIQKLLSLDYSEYSPKVKSSRHGPKSKYSIKYFLRFFVAVLRFTGKSYLSLIVVLGHQICKIVGNPDVLCILTNGWIVLLKQDHVKTLLEGWLIVYD